MDAAPKKKHVVAHRIEEVEVIVRMLVHGRHVPGLLVPLSVVVVGHHVDPVEVGGDLGHVVTSVHDCLARTHSSGQKQTLGMELNIEKYKIGRASN